MKLGDGLQQPKNSPLLNARTFMWRLGSPSARLYIYICIRVILGLYGDNGRENGNYHRIVGL